MFSNVVTLKSGGYIVMNQTEALVSIDVNSGRSTREHNIEDTALKTNLEAAEEVSRQLRLRDLAGLVVIDFIDMEEKRNNKAVERKLNDCLKNDRARIQVGRISHFGLLEMSRQRIRTGVLESSSVPCPHCAGTGLLRSTPSLALHVLRALEDTLLRSATHDIILRTRMETAFYILNQKRESLIALEARFGVTVTVIADNTIAPGQHFVIERGEPVTPRPLAEGEGTGPMKIAAPTSRAIHLEDIEIEEVVEEAEEETEATEEARSEGENGERKRRRRRRRRGGRDRGDRENRAEGESTDAEGDAEGDEDEGQDSGDDGQETGDEGEARTPREESEANGENGERKRRRRRRGGRRNRRDREGREETGNGEAEGSDDDTSDEADVAEAVSTIEDSAPVEAAPAEEAPAEEAPAKKPRRSRAKKTDETAVEAVAAPAEEAAEKPAKKPARSRAKKAAVEAAVEAPAQAAPVDTAPAAPAPVVEAAPEVKAAPAPEPLPEPEPEVEDPNRPKRSGWWSKAKKALTGE
jgi:ribonuclease E